MAAMESKTNLGCRRSLVASWAIGATMLVVAGAGFAPKSVHAQASAEAGAGSRASTPTERILMERVPAPGDSSHSSAVLLPSEYSASRRWPVLFLLDPRGRAMPSLERFADAADRLGYIVVSSY